MKVSNQQAIKSNNIKDIFTLITTNKGISRAKLASITGLSKATVSVLVDELIMLGFVVDEGSTTTNRQGRRPNRLEVDLTSKFILVFNWLENEIEGRVIRLDGSCAYQIVHSTEDSYDYVGITKFVYNSLLEKLDKDNTVLGICVMSPSTIYPETGKILSTTLPVKDTNNLIKRLRDTIPNLPMAFLNDTACFAYGEIFFMPEMKTDAVLFINLNKGIGAALFSKGELLGGASGNTTEFGHFSVDRYGEYCICGNRGCLEMVAGENALHKRAKDFGIDAAKMGYKDLATGLSKGLEGYWALSESFADDLAYAIGNFVTVYNVKHIIIGGRGQYLGDSILGILSQKLKGYGFQEFVNGTNLSYSKQNPELKTEFAGAAKYFIDKHFSFITDMQDKLFLE